MFKTQALLALRRMRKNRVSSWVNILGLSLGITAFIFILEYVAFEESYNSMYPEAARVFRLLSSEDAKEEVFSYFPPGYGPILEEQFTGISAVSRIADGIGNGVFEIPENGKSKVFRESNTAFVDPAYLRFFKRPVVWGRPDLSAPQTLVLSQTMAGKFFGNGDPTGKELFLSNQFGKIPYTVTGVIEDMPANSDIQHAILLSFQTLYVEKNRNGNGWADPTGLESGFVNVFLSLEDAQEADAMAQELTAFANKQLPDASLEFELQALEDLHLGTDLQAGLPTYGSRLFVRFLFLVAVLILAIAWVNYVNLSTAKGLERAREVGIRKVIGANKIQLSRQYLLETGILTFVATFIALGLIPLLQPYFNTLTGLPLGIHVLWGSTYLWVGLLTVLAGTLLAGGYVAFGLSNFSPINNLKSKVGTHQRGLWLRKGLVVLQFAISIAFIAGTLVLFQQLQFMYKQDIGMQLSHRIAIRGPEVQSDGFRQDRQRFREQLAGLPYVANFCSAGNNPGKGYNFSTDGITRPNPPEGAEKISYAMLMVDENYHETFNMKLLAGRTFRAEEAIKGWDAHKMVLNETAVRRLGFASPNASIGATLNWNDTPYELIGVIRDYNHYSLHTTVDPMVFLPSRNSGYFNLVLRSGDVQNQLAELQDIYQKAFPGNPFEYEFLDKQFADFYETEKRLSRLFTIASSLAIFISLLGLFGVITFIAQQKAKEIGIRKVLGASVSNIVQLLSKDFLVLVAIALMVSIPVSWYVIRQWLQDFAYHIDIQWWIYALAGFTALFITFLTVGLQSVRAALANPVDTLRSE